MRFVRFRLRTLLIAMTLIGASAGWSGKQSRELAYQTSIYESLDCSKEITYVPVTPTTWANASPDVSPSPWNTTGNTTFQSVQFPAALNLTAFR